MPVATLVYDRNGEYLSDTKDHAYIFKGDKYWKWDLKNNKAVDNESNKQQWKSCAIKSTMTTKKGVLKITPTKASPTTSSVEKK